MGRSPTVKIEATGGRLGRLHDQALGQVHAVVDVAEGPVGLEGGELRAVAGVDSLVAEVAGDLEDPLVASDHQPLQIELGGDAQAEVDVEGVGVGHERPGQCPAGLGLEDRGVHFDEVLGHQLPAEGGDGLEPGIEHRPALGVGQQVDLPLPVAGVGGGQAVPLVGEGAEGLGEEPQLLDVHRQFASTTGDGLTLGPDPVPEIGVGQNRRGPFGERGRLHEELDRTGHILEGGE